MKSMIVFLVCLVSAFLGVNVVKTVFSQMHHASAYEQEQVVARTEPQDNRTEVDNQVANAELRGSQHSTADSILEKSDFGASLKTDTDIEQMSNERVDYLSEIDTQIERMMGSL